jgi:hypothetical protein
MLRLKFAVMIAMIIAWPCLAAPVLPEFAGPPPAMIGTADELFAALGGQVCQGFMVLTQGAGAEYGEGPLPIGLEWFRKRDGGAWPTRPRSPRGSARGKFGRRR